MMTEGRRIAGLLLLASAVPALALAARQGRLIGKVVDPQGRPISGVTVTATSREVPGFSTVMTTDAKGLFIVDFEKLDVVYEYRFEKAGYVPAEVKQRWSVMGTERHQFTLQPAESPAVRQPPASTSNPAIAAFNAGVRALQTKDHETAGARFEEAVHHDPNLRQAWTALAQVHLEQKRYREAAEAAEKAIALGAGGQSIMLARWEAYRHLEDPAKEQQARETLDKAGRLEEEAKRIHNDAVALSRAGDHAEAFAKFQEAVEIDPSFQQAWLALAVTGLKVGRASEAAAAANKVLEAEPGHPEALRLQYNAALQVGDESGIVEALVALGAVEPTTARDNLFKLAVKAFDADDAVRAKERFRRILELDANHAAAHYHLGVLYVREGAKKEARSHLQRFLQLAPDHPEAETAKGLLGYLGS